MKEFCKSVYICRRYDEKSGVLFLTHGVYTQLEVVSSKTPRGVKRPAGW